MKFKDILNKIDPNQRIPIIVALLPYKDKVMVATTDSIYLINEKTVEEIEFVENSN